MGVFIKMVHNNATEVWLPIKDYEGLYEVSNQGRVKSLSKPFFGKSNPAYNRGIAPEKILKLDLGTAKGKEYFRTALNKNGVCRRFSVHRLVASAFIPNPENKPQVNHINGVKHDNRMQNLEWCTHSENKKHCFKIGLQKPNTINVGVRGSKHPKAKLSEKDVLRIRKLASKGVSTKNILNRYPQMSCTNINAIIAKRIWKHI